MKYKLLALSTLLAVPVFGTPPATSNLSTVSAYRVKM